MSKSSNLWLWGILATLLYFLLASWIFFHYCLGVCENTDKGAVGEYEAPTQPIIFDRSDADATTVDGLFPGYRDKIMASHGQDSILRIVGYYTDDEVNNTEFENLGLARAEQIRALFPNIPDSLIEKRASKRASLEGVGENAFLASNLTWLPPRVVETTEAPTEPEVRVENIDGQQLIYFPTNSSAKLTNTAVDQYLDQLVERVKITGEAIELVGHTDDRNSDEYNLTLGQRRADAIKRLLVKKGIAADQITSTSKGEAEPTAANSTERGQAQNRRVELVLNKKQ